MRIRYLNDQLDVTPLRRLGLVLFVLLLPLHLLADETQKHLSFDGKLEALVIPVGGAAVERRESRVEIRDSGGKILLSRSFASQDGKNGFIVYRAAWTPDSQFFVFSVYSSGGHEPWQFPTYFYSRKDRRLRLLDNYIGPVTDPDFEIVAPDLVRTFRIKSYDNFDPVAVEAKLSDLLKQKPKW
jgi:hypothetical protein